MSILAERLIIWHEQHGRHHLPWQKNRDPYAIWLSEIMLQQTQVNTVIPYYARFMREFPTIDSLAQASLDAVLSLWSGLGYYSRARNLHVTACRVMHHHQGQFPNTREAIQHLPGIGRSTAAAIAVFAFGQREAILDGNVKRILVRYFGISGFPGESKTQNLLWKKAEESLPVHYHNGKIEAYTQALMDFGTAVCTRHVPLCKVCPLQSECVALKGNLVNQLPATKPRRPLPQKETILLLLMQQQNILLEQRPVPGIWGKLWCPPEIGVGVDAISYCHHNLNLEVRRLIELPVLDHQFTHFKLRIRPQLLQVISSESLITPPKLIWTTPSDALAKGIPAPVRKLLKQTFLSDNSLHRI